MQDRESVRILQECIDLQRKKAQDYQNPNSSVKQADHYRRGIDSIHDMIHQKLLRAQSLIESGQEPQNESLEDTYKDMINYCSFAVAWIRREIDGQNIHNDIFNNPYPFKVEFEPEEVQGEVQILIEEPEPYPNLSAETNHDIATVLQNEEHLRKQIEEATSELNETKVADKMLSLEDTIDQVKNATNK